MKKKILLTSFLSLACCVSLIVGSTFALFTSESKVNIAVTGGKVEVVATADNLKLYSAQAAEGGALSDENGNTYEYAEQAGNTFINGGTAQLDGNVLRLINVVPGDKAEFTISVANNSTVAAQYRMKIACTNGETLFKALEVTMGGVAVQTSTAYTKWTALAAEEAVADVALSVALPMNAGNEYASQSAEIVYSVEAVQGNAQVQDTVFVPSGTNDLSQVFNAATGDTLVALTDDLTLASRDAGYIRGGKTVSLDLQGTTLTSETGLPNDPTTVLGIFDEGTKAEIANGTIIVPADMWRAVTVGTGARAHISDMTLQGGNDGCLTVFQESAAIVDNTTIVSSTGGCLYANGGDLTVNSGVYTQEGKSKTAWFNSVVQTANGGYLCIHDGQYTGEVFGVYVFSSGGTIDIYGGTFKADTVLRADYAASDNPETSSINVYGGSFDGKINIAAQAKLTITAGTFANTGLSLDAFKAYVASGSTVTEQNGVYTVTAANN